MLKTHLASEVGPEDDGDDVVVAGNVNAIRDLGGIIFVTLRDGTGVVQITSKEDDDEELFAAVEDLNREDAIRVAGTVKQTEQAPGDREIIPSELTVLSAAEESPPLDTTGETEAGLDTRLDWRTLDLRTPSSQAIFRVQETLIGGMVDYLEERSFRQVFTPCLLGVASEGGSEVFPVPFYDQEAFLRQDPQLHRELSVGGSFERVYELGPSWRAEKSNTSRHLSEHRGLAVEMAFIEDETDVMALQEEMIVAGIEAVVEECGDDLDELGVEVEVPETPFPVLEFPEVYDILEEEFDKETEFGEEYDRESEELLWEYVREEYGSDFFFVNKFPFEAKGIFYAMKDEDPTWARSVDLIYRGTELSTGGQREHHYDQVMKQVDELGMEESSVEWYTKFLKYGIPPHGGFNVGIERITMKLLGLGNIRETALFPRAPERLVP